MIINGHATGEFHINPETYTEIIRGEMDQTEQAKKLKMVRLEVTVSPVHEDELQKEIQEEASRGRVITKSDIIREEQDRRYLTRKRRTDKV